jgi:hypothetical protein
MKNSRTVYNGIWQPSPESSYVRRCWILAKLDGIPTKRPESCKVAGFRQQFSDFGQTKWILTEISGFQEKVAGSNSSQVVANFYKRSCKNEEFKSFKTVNRFSKIKEVFTVKLKMIFVDHYFLSN